MIVPIGTTHFIPAQETDFDQSPSFMKWGYHFTGPESGTQFYCWYHWYQNAWHKDQAYSNRHNRLKPISELVT